MCVCVCVCVSQFNMVNQLCVCVCVCVPSRLVVSLCIPMDCSLPGSSVHETLQARILEWGAISSSPTSTFTLILGFQAFLSAVYLWSLLAREPSHGDSQLHSPSLLSTCHRAWPHRAHSVHPCSGGTVAINS